MEVKEAYQIKAPRRIAPAGRFGVVRSLRSQTDVDRLRAFLSLFNFKLNFLALFKLTVTFPLNCCVVDKHVAAIIASDKPKPFVGVEPFDTPFNHGAFLLSYALTLFFGRKNAAACLNRMSLNSAEIDRRLRKNRPKKPKSTRSI